MSSYKDMSMKEFLVNVLEFDLTPNQGIIVDMYEELRTEKILDKNMPIQKLDYKPLG